MTSVMQRRTFLARTGAMLVTVPLVAEVQQAGNVYTIGVLTSAVGPTPRYSPIARLRLARCGARRAGAARQCITPSP